MIFRLIRILQHADWPSALSMFKGPEGRTHGRGKTVGNGKEGWAPNAIFVHTDGAAGDRIYVNSGTKATASWTLIPRAALAEDALAVYGVPIYSIRAADGAAMGVTETAGDHYLSLAANVLTLLGEIANNETEVSVSLFQFVLPPEYVAGGDVQIRVKHQSTGAGTAVVSTVDFSVYEQDGEGAVGGDLVTTAAQTIVKDTWTTSDFVVTAAGLVAGDILNVVMTTSVIETATANIQAQLDGIAVLLDVKG